MSASEASLPWISTAEPAELIGTYWERAYRFAAMITRNDQESADIAQEALLKVMQELPRFDARRGPFEPWLWRVVLNVARDAGRAAKRRRILTNRLGRMIQGEPLGDPEALALQHMSDAHLLGAVRRLPKRPRTVIALRFGAQLSYSEVGQQLGISQAGALMATRRALLQLRRELQTDIHPKEAWQ